ncbi:M56 family metallopeptidase [Flavobacterium phragmitis]|uniref:Signal transducer regulating beta-lactamase production, contains metallopeptidase domain n=1 Tax=Flavobacterium phragmitis TaxID=739143 RepID=A0A1I1XJE5_9FLAO|nr:M56 family metallopeptidase [Flavobacterium phragmitis]SFE05510.1 Signal transducer regulating beta-lactamase production, contains metallopeptidase domain [Flavobacterium phragmitis]
MEAVFIYIAKSVVLMLLFYCVYFFLLRRETFFNSNRWFLLSGLIISSILPLLSYTKVIWIDAVPNLNTNIQSALLSAPEKQTSDINWSLIILGLYLIGFIIFLLKLAVDFYSLNSIIKGKKVKQQADFKFIDTPENIAPFSYFEYIVYNSSLYTASELENIIEHEKVHSDQNHTIDVLISRFFSIIFWFNPIVWLYKKAISQNLEFIADSEASKKISDKKAYQYTLLKITTHENCVAITNHFYQSLIKKRIVMLNKNQSKKRNSWKYYVVIPALAAFVILFQVEVIAKERQQTVKVSGETKSVDVYKIKKNSTDAELKEIKEKLKSIHNIDFEASEIKRDSHNNLTSIKIDIKNGNQKTQSIQTSSETIEEFGILVITDKEGKKKVGIQTSEEGKTSKTSKVAVSKKIKNTKSDTDSDQASDSHIIITNNPNSKTDTHVNINSFTSTKTNSDTNTDISTVVTTDSDSKTLTKVITVGGKTKVAISNSGKNNNLSGNPLIIFDGEEMPSTFNLKNIDSQNIESISVFKGVEAVAKYGEKGSNGVIEIESKR